MKKFKTAALEGTTGKKVNAQLGILSSSLVLFGFRARYYLPSQFYEKKQANKPKNPTGLLVSLLYRGGTWNSRHRAFVSPPMKKYIIEAASFQIENGNEKPIRL